jgi:hypothetical protein
VFVKAGTAFFPGSSLTGNGLLVSDGEEWKRQRRLSNPAFRKAAVDRCGVGGRGDVYVLGLDVGLMGNLCGVCVCVGKGLRVTGSRFKPSWCVFLSLLWGS